MLYQQLLLVLVVVQSITLANDGSVNGVIQGMTVTGTGIAAGTTVGTVNTNTRVITLSAALTGCRCSHLW